MKDSLWKVIMILAVVMTVICEPATCQSSEVELEPWPEVPTDTHVPPRWVVLQNEHTLIVVAQHLDNMLSAPSYEEFWKIHNIRDRIEAGVLFWWIRKEDGSILKEGLPFPRSPFGIGEAGGENSEHFYDLYPRPAEVTDYSPRDEPCTVQKSADGKSATLTWEHTEESDWPIRTTITYSINGRGVDTVKTLEVLEEIEPEAAETMFFWFCASYIGGAQGREHYFGPTSEEVFGTNAQLQATGKTGGIVPWVHSPKPQLVPGAASGNIQQLYNLSWSERPMWYILLDDNGMAPFNSPWMLVWSFENTNTKITLWDWATLSGPNQNWSGYGPASDNINVFYDMRPGRVHVRRGHFEMVKVAMGPGGTLDQAAHWQKAVEVDEGWRSQLVPQDDTWGPTIRLKTKSSSSLEEITGITVSEGSTLDMWKAIDYVMDDEVNGGCPALYSNGVLHPEGGNVSFHPEVDTTKPGNYTVTITATDLAGNSTSRDLSVTVVAKPDKEAPKVTLNGASRVEWKVGWVDPWVVVTDNKDNPPPAAKRFEKRNGKLVTFNPLMPSLYTFEYIATDQALNTGKTIREVNVTTKEAWKYLWYLASQLGNNRRVKNEALIWGLGRML